MNKHHLFTYYECRQALIDIFGEPKTTAEHEFITKEARKVWKKMPTYEIDIKLHETINKKGKARNFNL